MPSRFIDPFAQFLDSNGDPLSGGTLTFYATGTSTKIDTYSDQDLATANANPVTLDSAGRLPNAVFLLARDYKVVLANSGGTQIWSADPVAGEPVEQAATELTISAGSMTPTLALHKVDTESDAASDDLDNILTTNLRDGALLTISAANAARTVVVKDTAGGAGQIHTADGEDITLSDANQYVVLRRDGTDWYEVARSIGIAHVNRYMLYGAPQRFTASGTYTPSSSAVRFIEVILIGGGGGSAGSNTTTGTNYSASAGGGGGAGLRFTLSGISGGSYTATVTVGSGGTAGASAGGAGGAGGNTVWSDGSVNVTAGGGQASNVVTSGGNAAGAAPGEGGTVTLTATTASFTEITRVERQDGGEGIASDNARYAFAGFGGAGPFGQGSQIRGAGIFGSSGQNAGAAGRNYGSGGGGAVTGEASTGDNGGAGSGGLVIVYEYV